MTVKRKLSTDKKKVKKKTVSKNKVGKPRTVSLPPDEMIKLGQEMVKWVKENNPLHLSAWYAIEKDYLESEWETMIRRQEFVGYYEKCLKIIGQKYLDSDSNVREGASQRWQRIYFKDLKRHEDEKADREHQLKKDLIDYQSQKENAKVVSPYASEQDMAHEIMMLKDALRKEQEKNANKS